MYLKVLLYYVRSNSLYKICYIQSFVIKMGYFPLIKALLQNLTLSPFCSFKY